MYGELLLEHVSLLGKFAGMFHHINVYIDPS